MTYAILTFGCRVNQADSFELEDALRMRGAVPAPPSVADFIIVNTCSVTSAADQGARRAIRGISRDNPAARIVVTGCYASRNPDDLAGLPNVISIVPNEEKDHLLRVVDRREALAPGNDLPVDDRGCGAAMMPGVMGRTAYPLRVQTGCDERCAFCVIPSTRGRSRSRNTTDVCSDVRRIVDSGYKEVWLVGVHLGSFGRDSQPRTSLLELLRELDRVSGDVTFRLGSLEPMDCSRDLLSLFVDSGRFAPHFHLPLQHVSDAVLRAMRRPYSFEFYRDLVSHIHARLPGAAIGTDLIVGFPGESAADVDLAVRELDQLPVAYVHVFPYSDRPGTEAAALAGKVDPREIKDRARALRDVGARLARRFVESQAGEVRQGLTLEDGTLVLTDNFLKIRIPPGLARNTRVRVRIDSPEGTGSAVA